MAPTPPSSSRTGCSRGRDSRAPHVPWSRPRRHPLDRCGGNDRTRPARPEHRMPMARPSASTTRHPRQTRLSERPSSMRASISPPRSERHLAPRATRTERRERLTVAARQRPARAHQAWLRCIERGRRGVSAPSTRSSADVGRRVAGRRALLFLWRRRAAPPRFRPPRPAPRRPVTTISLRQTKPARARACECTATTAGRGAATRRSSSAEKDDS